jgi:DNA repair protein RecO (recombination protein O)
MPAEKATGLVLRMVDYSETSRIGTIWTREFGKVRVLAKGGRRLRGPFESALDLLTLASIVFLRKSSGGLDLLTEAQVVERFPRLRTDLSALYAAYYLAELLGDWTEDYDPHPNLFDEAVETLRTLGTETIPVALRLLRFETVLLRELGYAPALDACAGCGRPTIAGPDADPISGPDSGMGSGSGSGSGEPLIFSATAGGVMCGQCHVSNRGKTTLSRPAWQALRALYDQENPGAWRNISPAPRAELRRLHNLYISHLLGRRPRTMTYLGS